MDFKQALIAHLQGGMVEAKGLMTCDEWGNFSELVRTVEIGAINDSFGQGYEFRIKPRTVMCNGVEVPAPESVAPAVGTQYCTPDMRHPERPYHYKWSNDTLDEKLLCAKLVYLDKDACIARTNAMLIVS